VLIIACVQQKWILANYLKTIADFVLLCDLQAYLYAYNNNPKEKVHVDCLGFDSFTKLKLIEL